MATDELARRYARPVALKHSYKTIAVRDHSLVSSASDHHIMINHGIPWSYCYESFENCNIYALYCISAASQMWACIFPTSPCTYVLSSCISLHLHLQEGLKYFLCGAVITSGRAAREPLEWEMRLVVVVVRETKCPFSKR